MSSLQEKIRALQKNIKLRDKILLSLLLLSSFSVLIASYMFYLRSSTILIKRAKESTMSSMRQAQEFISFRVDSAKDVSSMAYLDQELKEMIFSFKTEEDDLDRFFYYTKLQNKMKNMSLDRNIDNVRIYIDDNRVADLGTSHVLSESVLREEDWYEHIIAEDGGVLWLLTYDHEVEKNKSEKLVSIARTIPSIKPNDDHLGIIIVDLSEQGLRQIVAETNSEFGEVYLIDIHGFVISSTQEEDIGNFIQRSKYIPFDNRFKDGQYEAMIDDEESAVFHMRIPNVDWQLISVMPIAAIRQDANTILRFMIIILVLVMMVAVVVSFKLSNNITRRLKTLSEKMDLVKEGNWDVNIEVKSHDEIGDLQNNFNYMTASMQRLIEEKYQAEIDIRKAELRALQAQINPHFLYNILDTINWMAMKHGAEDINYIVSKLAKFFRLSLSSGKEMVKIADELEHIALYVDIQNIRFDDNINLSIDVDLDLLDYYTINLILQPLVENAILHGINENPGKAGNVDIIGYHDVESVVILVIDDGIGMTEEKIEEILSGTISGSYGVRNVNERLSLKFGDPYGLSYESTVGVGTKAIVRIPIIESEEEDFSL